MAAKGTKRSVRKAGSRVQPSSSTRKGSSKTARISSNSCICGRRIQRLSTHATKKLIDGGALVNLLRNSVHHSKLIRESQRDHLRVVWRLQQLEAQVAAMPLKFTLQTYTGESPALQSGCESRNKKCHYEGCERTDANHVHMMGAVLEGNPTGVAK